MTEYTHTITELFPKFKNKCATFVVYPGGVPGRGFCGALLSLHSFPILLAHKGREGAADVSIIWHCASRRPLSSWLASRCKVHFLHVLSLSTVSFCCSRMYWSLLRAVKHSSLRFRSKSFAGHSSNRFVHYHTLSNPCSDAFINCLNEFSS